ncbi:MAG TPA: hypothetical protein PKW51_08950 [Methanoregulaceae archaeon]|jgi:hypothetical protein|nr:hypothetical protein [Methanoregulaceae archaeon]HQO65024.1 hypothetical protein [Syntrophorhabdus sp.]HQP56869.1 hypothetical protein [Syntrophorhabdus sp.]
MKFKKGDHVEWKNKDRTIEHGVVEKGGSKKITVIKLGGKIVVTGSAACFRPSSFTIPLDPDNPMAKWGVRNYRVVPGHDDLEPFVCIITHDGKDVIRARQDGWGGPNLYERLSCSPQDIEDRLRAESKAWAQHYGWKDPIEAEDCWLYWATKLQPYGVMSKEYIDDNNLTE